ncbi:MAG: ROK family protein [Muribaculaceae bacterium]|nr:ROK family protein [Muribaculaceae bacterium]
MNNVNDKVEGASRFWDKDYVLGIDIGGTNTEFAVVNRRGDIVKCGSIPTCGHKDFHDYASKLKTAVDDCVAKAGVAGHVRGIGVGAPCANQYSGCIEAATDLPWPSPIPLAAVFEQMFSLPVAITNDANAAAAGEMRYGQARELKNFIMVTLGTGVGGGIVCDGHLLSGSQGFAGEIGHVVVKEDSDRLCGCGRYGCLETYCSAKGVMRTARKMLAESDEPSALRDVAPDELTPKVICECANKGDALAKRVFDFTGRVLGEACANFAAITDPDAFMLFGGVSKAGDLIALPMREALEANALHLYRNRIEILFSSLNDAEAALLGASAMAWDIE